jgi:hypothetical protein
LFARDGHEYQEAVMADETETTTETEQPQTIEELRAENARIAAALGKANKEAERRRKELDTIAEAETIRKQAEMTETDRLKAEKEQADKRAADAEAKAKLTLIRAAFVSEAAKAGAAYPEDVYLLAGAKGIDVDEEGTVTGVAEVVAALVKAGRVPMSKGTPAPDLDGGAGGGSHTKGVVLTAEQEEAARRMNISPEKYKENLVAMQKK